MKVAFYKAKTRLFNRLVSWWLRGPYSHCELVVWTNPQGLSLCISSSYMDGGVRSKWIALDPDHWDLVPVVGSTARAMVWLAAQKDAGYDVPGLLGFVWRRVEDDQAKWFCSEAVAAMLGFVEAWRMDPMTLWVALAAAANQATQDPAYEQKMVNGDPVLG
jgi:hypothetical protein